MAGELDSHGDDSALRSPLHVLPAAPLDLTAEIYWHIARRLREAAQHDPEAQTELSQLNAAYRALAGRDHFGPRLPAQEPAAPPPPKPARRLFRHRRAPAAERRDPHDVLRLTPDAPPDVVDVAYRYWVERARGEWAEHLDLDELHHAHRTLTGAPEPTPPAPPGRPSEPPARPAKPRKSRLRPLFARVGAACGRLLGRAAHALRVQLNRAGARLWAIAKKRANDPFNEYERALKNARAASDPEMSVDLQGRFAALGVREHPPPPPASPEPAARAARPEEIARPPVAHARDTTPRLVHESGPCQTKEVPLNEAVSLVPDSDAGPLVVGGAPGAPARVSGWGGRYAIQVLAPEAVIRVNGRPVLAAVLNDGDRIQVGVNVFRFARGAGVATTRGAT